MLKNVFVGWMNKWPSHSIAVGNQISQFKLPLLSNRNYEGGLITIGLHVSHSGSGQAGQLCGAPSRMRVHNYLMVGCQDGPVIEEPSTAFASEARLSPFSSTLMFKPENMSPGIAMWFSGGEGLSVWIGDWTEIWCRQNRGCWREGSYTFRSRGVRRPQCLIFPFLKMRNWSPEKPKPHIS